MFKQEKEKKYCNKCDRCLTDDKGATITGFQIKVTGLDKSPQMRELLGKYAPKGDRVIFRFCYECFLDALFNGLAYFDGCKK